jgi:hypothetical protein
MDLKAITNKYIGRKIFSKMAERFSRKPAVKINFDESTRSIVEKIGPNNSDLSNVMGLINFGSGQMHLVKASHGELARLKGLQLDEKHLMDGWYGFSVDSSNLKSGLLKVSPASGQFGGIPIKYSSIFEKYMKGLFGDKAGKVLFYHMNYARNLPDDTKISWLSILKSKHMLLMSNSLSNSELSKFISRINPDKFVGMH